uniref:Uncharacterized protein n=1 Tax=Zea mays TaxID=4577 RepID=B6SLD4_MAIZE|nr:hypothetical protein [Zea mays]
MARRPSISTALTRSPSLTRAPYSTRSMVPSAPTTCTSTTCFSPTRLRRCATRLPRRAHHHPRGRQHGPRARRPSAPAL